MPRKRLLVIIVVEIIMGSIIPIAVGILSNAIQLPQEIKDVALPLLVMVVLILLPLVAL